MPVIGFLAARFDEAYQYAVWNGAVEEAKSLGVSLVFFGGQRISSPIGYEAMDNIAFDLAKRCDIQGLIVMSNVIGTYISNEEQADFLHHFHDMELVTIGVGFEGIDSVCVDASGGMNSIVEHLVRIHGRKRFLFLAGPKGHIESDERKAEFLQSLSCLLPEAKPAIIHGDFTEDDACARVNEFLDAGGVVDAIVAANDQMAFGALASLSTHGLSVPADVSLTGFDDTEDSRFSDPPLTTVRQPVATLGRVAMRHMAAKLGFVPKEPSVCLPVSCIIRESCGCQYSSNHEETKGRAGAVYMGGGEEKLPAETEEECRHFASQRILVEKRAAILGEIEASLISSFSMEDILKEIACSARELGISSCWLSLFDSSDSPPVWSRLFLAADNKAVRILAPQGMCFRTAELVPGGLPEKWNSYVCEPLCFGNDRLGYLICTADSTDRRMYSALRDQVSSAIKGAMLMTAERNKEKDLERSVYLRTLELSTTNSRLVDEMERRKSLERELLDISNTIMGDIGRDIHDNLCQDIAVLGIMAAVLEGKLSRLGLSAEAGEAAAIARRSGETAAKAKDMARGLYPAEVEAKGIVSAIESLVASATVRERKEPHIRLEVTKGFSVRDSRKALQLYRIVQEALSNAVKYSKASEIKVGLYADRENITVEVADNGIGIPRNAKEEGGLGFHILRYRASVIGGELRVRSSSGEGTTVTCRVAR
ncbi:MAG: substrate-binding domain-containing protein [Spirochaetaceae bacterium]|nr:substrate-binding domain-containing protein [Spirochaetaceae bacterium]